MLNLSAKAVLFIVLGIFSTVYLVYWLWRIGGVTMLLETGIGFITNFFDQLGIGSFAPTTAIFKLRGMVPDEKIPGTLNVGHCVPTLAEAFITIAIVQVDMKTLVLLIAASVVGSWLGAGVVSKWSRRYVQIGMGFALLVAAVLFTMKGLHLAPAEGTTLGLEGWRLCAGMAGNFVLGAFMTLGIGLYGPCMIMISLLSMNPIAAYPIMMGSCAFLMPVGSLRFIKADSYSLRPAVGLAIGGVPGVLIAAFLLGSLSVTVVRWLVVVVVLYTAAMMLRSAYGSSTEPQRA
jgi:uncharacterized membrane protein YfcA